MNVKDVFIAVVLFMMVHTFVWFSSNAQFVDSLKSRAMLICLMLALPTAYVSFYASRFGYTAFGSIWAVRLIGFGISYIMFPLLSWILMNESPFNLRTMICIGLSALIVWVQLYLK
jgi:hypothetical protein